MNIFGIGGAEIVLVLLIALVVAGPKRMAVWAYQLGKFVGKLRKQWEQVAEVIQKEMDAAGVNVEIPKDLPTRQNVTKMVSKALKPAMDEVEKAAKEVQKELEPVSSEVKGLQKDISRTGQEVNQNLKLSSARPAAASPKTPAPAKPAETPAPSRLGTWGNGDVSTPKNDTADGLGTWSNAEPSGDNPA